MSDASLPPPPLVTLPIIEQWDCHQCGQCCKGHTVLLDPDDVERLQQQRWDEHPDFRGRRITQRVGFLWSQPVLAQQPDGSCIFLMSDGRCRIHAEFGEPAKPWACRMFPFQILPTDVDLRVTMRRSCPSAAADMGRPLAEHVPDIRPFITKALPAGPQIEPPALHRERQRTWPRARLVMTALEQQVLDADLPLVRRLAHGLALTDLLSAPSATGLSDAELKEYLQLSAPSVSELVGVVFAERVAPTGWASLLFRQTAAEYVRHHPNLGDRPSLMGRWRLFRSALRFAKGSGSLPPVHPQLPAATFEQLEQPLGNLSAEVMKPLQRFFEAMIASTQYCGAGRFGWSIVDGYRALALAYPIGLWMLRWLAVGRQPTPEDAIQVVSMLDRSHFYPLLGGSRHRRRVTLLADHQQIYRLLAWHAR